MDYSSCSNPVLFDAAADEDAECADWANAAGQCAAYVRWLFRGKIVKMAKRRESCDFRLQHACVTVISESDLLKNCVADEFLPDFVVRRIRSFSVVAICYFHRPFLHTSAHFFKNYRISCLLIACHAVSECVSDNRVALDESLKLFWVSV